MARKKQHDGVWEALVEAIGLDDNKSIAKKSKRGKSAAVGKKSVHHSKRKKAGAKKTGTKKTVKRAVRRKKASKGNRKAAKKRA